MGARLKTLNVLLQEGCLNGVISIEENSWQNGVLLLCPRGKIDDLRNQSEIHNQGVYLLFSGDSVFVGRLSDFEVDFPVHATERNWWKKVAVITTKNDSLTDGDVDYLMSSLLNRSSELGTLVGADEVKTDSDELNKYRKAVLDEFLDNARLILELVGVSVFSQEGGEELTDSEPSKPSTPAKHKKIDSGAKKPTIPMQTKSEVKSFLKSKGFSFSEAYMSYARKLTMRNFFWDNARESSIHNTWYLVLNNQERKEIFVLEFPPDAFETSSDIIPGKVRLRPDKPFYMDLEIDADTFVDMHSGINFSKYIKHHYTY